MSRTPPGTMMRPGPLLTICLTLLVFLMPLSALAISLDEAAQQAARQYDAKVLSARTVGQGANRVHEIKLLTKNGVVKTVRIPDNGKN